jgi:hypothetical protein
MGVLLPWKVKLGRERYLDWSYSAVIFPDTCSLSLIAQWKPWAQIVGLHSYEISIHSLIHCHHESFAGWLEC